MFTKCRTKFNPNSIIITFKGINKYRHVFIIVALQKQSYNAELSLKAFFKYFFKSKSKIGNNALV